MLSYSIFPAILGTIANNNKTIAFTGLPGNPINDIAAHSIVIPSKITSIVQEMHISIIHVICKLIERELFSDA